MTRASFLLSLVLLVVWSCTSAQARVGINVDLSTQTMRVSSANGEYVWPISSARSGYSTPTGSYGIQRMEAMHRSHKYHNSPMPHSLFFKGGYAIHGSYAVGSLGSPASHGCVRLSPEHAAALFSMVAAEGAHITITGHVAERPVRYAAHGRRSNQMLARDDAPRLRHMRDDPPSALGYAPIHPNRYEDWMENPFGY